MSAGRALARGGLLVSGAFLVSRLLGYVRVVVITSAVPDQQALDAWFAAFRIPDLIFQLVAAGALSSAVIPTIATLIGGGEQARAWRVVSAVVNLMLVALVVIAAVLFVLAPAVVAGVVAPGWSGAQLEQTVELTRIMLLSPILLALGAAATSVLNARGRFAASALAPVTYNIAIIAGALFLAGPFGLPGIAAGVVIGSACHLAIQLHPLFRGVGFRYSPTLAREDPETRRTLLLMAPRALGLAGAQLQLMAAGAIGTTLAAGAVSSFNLAFTVFQIPIGVVGVPLGIVALPALSTHVAAGATDEFVHLVDRTLRLMAFVMVPLTLFGLVAARPVMTVLFGLSRTATEQLDLGAVAVVLAAFLVALPSETAIVVLARAFYAMRDTRTPVGAALLAVAVSIVVSLAAAPAFGAPGLAAGVALASWVETGLLFVLLGRRVPGLRLAASLRSLVACLACAAVAAGVLWAILAGAGALVTPGPGRLVSVIVNAIELAVGGLIAGLVYLGAAQVLHIPEGPTIIRLLTSAVRRGEPA